MLSDRPKFQIISIVANELDLLRLTLPASIDSLTKNSKHSYELILQVDGAAEESIGKIIKMRDDLKIDEIRIRNKQNKNFICPGDPSNNSHFHALSGKSDYTIEIESDVIAVLEESGYDALGRIVDFFDRHTDVCLISSVIDYDCWAWKLEDVGVQLEENVRNVNRVSSHFLIYHNQRFLDFTQKNGIYSFTKYSDDNNYEDVISKALVKSRIPIAFFENWEVKVRHCDEKEYDGSLYYKRIPELKKKIARKMIRKYSYKRHE